MESVRSKLPQFDVSTPSRNFSDSSATPETILSELQTLRKKYDAIVEYTVHLTAERDYHFTALEALRREYSKEKSKKKAGDTPTKKDTKTTDKVVVQQGFSLLVVLLVGLVSFIIARYTASRGGVTEGEL